MNLRREHSLCPGGRLSLYTRQFPQYESFIDIIIEMNWAELRSRTKKKRIETRVKWVLKEEKKVNEQQNDRWNRA